MYAVVIPSIIPRVKKRRMLMMLNIITRQKMIDRKMISRKWHKGLQLNNCRARDYAPCNEGNVGIISRSWRFVRGG
ncbi:hypothetical protein BFG52_13755 [Acinetobacter larvae]|uniref:Uncharacterized protein n=1 Tax=Acinetobacter larvae TaxID=1789224 RepID=A0A1B2M293_9GAMM|nr:hypothetical protein BFG52_13755 [Acinetobacter larvae]